MNPYRINDNKSKYIIKTWQIPYDFTLYSDGKPTETRIHWSEYWEQELNKFCLEQDVYLVSHSIVSGIEISNPTDTRPEYDKNKYYGNMISCVFLK